MKITIVGAILIIAIVIALLIILDVSVQNPSLAQLLSKIRNSIQHNKRPGASRDISEGKNLPEMGL